MDAVFLDFQKAFDKVPHKRLLKKIRAHGVGGSVDWGLGIGYPTGSKELE